MLETWLGSGKLDDPHAEFMVTEQTLRICDSVFTFKYKH